MSLAYKDEGAVTAPGWRGERMTRRGQARFWSALAFTSIGAFSRIHAARA